MDMHPDTVAAIAVRAIQIAGICATALDRADAMLPEERHAASEAMADIAHLLEVLAGDAMPPGLAPELQARAAMLRSPKERG